MKTEQFLDRTFRLARRVPAPIEHEPAYGLETSVLASWREATAKRSTGGGLLPGLRWAALAACAIALLTAALKSDELTAFQNRSDPVSRVADSAFAVSYGYE